MKTQVRILAIGLLFFNGVSALYGGSILILDPSGEKLQLPVSLLSHSLFKNYLIPGVLLLLLNGFFSLTAIYLSIGKHRWYPQFIIYQGIVLAIWLTVQVNLLQIVNLLHYIMATVALLLIICGWLLGGLTQKKKSNNLSR